MLPMVTDGATSSIEARELVERELTHLRRHGHELPERVQVGTMLEVPFAALSARRVVGTRDFLSVGSNDLLQFLFAVDRGNALVAKRFDPLSAPMMRALKMIIDKGKEHNKPVTLCGELASSPIGALALLGLGYRSMSLSPTAVGPVKAMVLDLDVRKLEKLTQELVAQQDPNLSIRDKLTAFAEAEGLAL